MKNNLTPQDNQATLAFLTNLMSHHLMEQQGMNQPQPQAASEQNNNATPDIGALEQRMMAEIDSLRGQIKESAPQAEIDSLRQELEQLITEEVPTPNG